MVGESVAAIGKIGLGFGKARLVHRWLHALCSRTAFCRTLRGTEQSITNPVNQKAMISILIDVFIDLIKALFSLLGELGTLIFDLVFQNHRPGYHDEMASSWSYLSRWNKGFSVNGSRTGRITAEASNRHMAIIGPSGVGKTTTSILASIFLFIKQGLGMLINDISGEVCEKTSGFAHEVGYKIYTFDTEHPETSDYFNPLAYAHNSAQISHIAHLLIKSS